MNPNFRDIIVEAKRIFIRGYKFKIYARLFAEIVYQILSNQNVAFLETFELEHLGMFTSILFKQRRKSTGQSSITMFQPAINSFEIRLELVNYTRRYLKQKTGGQDLSVFDHIHN